MKKTTLSKILFILLCMPSFMMAQQKNSQENVKCLTDNYNAELLETNPNMMGSETFRTQLNQKIQELESTPQRRVVLEIPLVVHVLHNGEPLGTGANITDAQVLSQVTVMNEDFRMMVGTPGESTAGGVDVEVEFVMAQRTPNGCPTNGINRVNICQDGTNESDVNYWKAQTIWNRDLYMNMWSSKYVGDLSGTLGFAQFPGGPADTDGVSAGHIYFGSSDYDDGSFQLSPPYDKGRTMTHEVGHYLGLYHTFQGGCLGGGDLVADTPAVDSPNFGCPTGHVSCGTVDMIENYMDYTDDTCMNTYTAGQKVRVQAVMAGSRAGLVTSNGATPLTAVNNDAEIAIECLSTVPCTSDVNANIKIVNWGTSTLTSATISYDVDGNGATNYNWSGSLAYGEYDAVSLPTISADGGTQTLNATITNVNGGADARACNDVASKSFSAAGAYVTNEVRMQIIPDDYGSDTTWEFIDESNTVLYSGGPYTDGNSEPINEVFTLNATGCYTFTIYDVYGDGICCAWGNGSYELRTNDDTLIFSGGTFGDSEDTSIIVSSLSTSENELNNSISIFPNPTINVLTIKATSNTVPDAYAVYNMLGQIVLSNKVANESDLTINTSELSNGMYFIKISKESSQVSLPFIKK
ncbi:M43 family zinc metalloprotease [Formosa maritima]|uniref:T9SS type A sorting domain-containing protein n=1 Tax=Formosa maritima TaxID=2592046 RepID=A0A5D0G1A7_9FLAO|nr:M43 family zinc metalloprotease [Formosa maritima]TYA52401.1 T9SS type A sorting domain-containing protein [Formosa maritima]